MTASDRDLAAEWAAAEGWNPGHHDMECFSAVDPQGFWGRYGAGEMIASISVVNWGQPFSLLSKRRQS